MWKADDDAGLLIDEIASELGRKSEAKKWKKTLADNLFYDCISLCQLIAEDWIAMGLPLCVLAIVLQRVDSTPSGTTPSVSAKRTTSDKNAQKNMLLKQKQKPVESASFSDISVLMKANTDKKKATTKKKSKKPQIEGIINGKVNVIGRENLVQILLSRYCEDIGKESSKIANIPVHEWKVLLEISSSAAPGNDAVDCAILVFARNSPISFGKMRDKLIQSASQLMVPILLVGVLNPGENKQVPLSDINSFVEGIKAIKYIEFSDEPCSGTEVFIEAAKIVVRAEKFSNSKINEKLIKMYREKKTTEIVVKKKQLTGLPNGFLLFCNYLQKLNLDHNQIRYFPSEITECLQLRELYLNFNLIEDIPISITNLTALTKFEIESNAIEFLPISALQSMEQLKELKVTGNPLTKFPYENKNKLPFMEFLKSIKEGESQQEEKEVVQAEPPKPTFKIFSVSIADLMVEEYKINEKIPIPRIIPAVINFLLLYALSLEGIFRLAGETEITKQLREELDNGVDISFSSTENPHNVTSILKQWFRALPEPVFLYQNYETILSASNLDEEEQLAKLKEILGKLPRENYMIIRQIFRMMYLISQNVELNRMDEGNIAKVMAPNLLFSKDTEDPMSIITSINSINDVLSALVRHFPKVFESDVDLFEIDYLQTVEKPFAILYRKISGHVKSIVATEISSTKEYFWTADSKGTYRIWRTSDMKLMTRFDTNKKRINSLTRCGKNIWVSTADSIQIRTEDTGDLLNEIPETAFALCAVNDTVWTVRESSIIIIDNSTFDENKIEIEPFPTLLTRVNNTVWGVCVDRKIRVWDLDQNNSCVSEIEIMCGRLNSLSFINGLVWGGCDGGTITLWDPVTYQLKDALEGHHQGKVFGAESIGNYVWTYSWDGKICIYDPNTLQYVCTLPNYHADAIGGIECLFDEQTGLWKVFTASWDKTVTVWLAKDKYE